MVQSIATVNANVKMNGKQKREAKKLENAQQDSTQPSQETIYAANKALLGGADTTTVVNTPTTTAQPEPQETTIAIDANGKVIGDTTTEPGEGADTTGRVHGPYTSEEEARKSPVVYGSKSKKNGETLPLHVVSIDLATLKALVVRAEANGGELAEYLYGMNYHHAAIQFLKSIGGEVSQSGGSGRGKSKAVAVANKRASEAEMIAANAVQAKIDAENSEFARLVLLVKKIVAGGMDANMVLDTVQNVELRQRVESAVAAG